MHKTLIPFIKRCQKLIGILVLVQQNWSNFTDVPNKLFVCLASKNIRGFIFYQKHYNFKLFRSSIQETLLELNPNWQINQIGELAPDGDIDVEISNNALANFQVPFCKSCGERSILKTDVVFFGDNVPRDICDLCYEKVV